MADKRGTKKPDTVTGAGTDNKQSLDFPVVGIGASAGGLEAFEQFFRKVPPDIGMAFVLVTHLDPGHHSILTEILQRSTAMPVQEVQDQMAVAPNNVYVIPPNREMSIFKGMFQLTVPENPRGQRMPIDFFLRSLAEEQGEKAIGVVLSGTGSDGTLGLRAILGVGGISFVQDPSAAKYNGMPTSAIESGLATYVLPVDRMPEQLMAYVKNLFDLKIKPPSPSTPPAAGALNRIMQTIRSATGHDFSLYKQSTVSRRIERRMIVHNIADRDLYARYLKEHPEEVQHLFKELLINVTSFFRDPESFEALKRDLLPRLLSGKPETYVIRVWIVGCATGEEAYSIAILLSEYMEEHKHNFKVQIYSTDIDEEAIAIARSGSYQANIAMDVSEERLRRFFIKEEAGYRIKKDIREMVVFAVQNIIKDPPFTKLDLVSCRNLLIYLEPELQNRIIPAFHYALKPGGALFLSSSERIGNHAEFFAPINRKWKIYQAKTAVASVRAVMTRGLSWDVAQPGRGPDEILKAKEPNFAELAKKTLLQSFAPASVITDVRGDILYVHGDTGKYLRPAPGQPSLNILEIAREGLQTELRTAINSAVSKKKQVVCKGLPVKTNGGRHAVDLIVRPLADPQAAQQLLIISFLDMEEQTKPARKERPASKRQPGRVEELEQELLYTRETLQATIEESQASNEELKSTNEELQSTNEELQSTNEELETSKEELQSINEELVTLNAELQAKIEQLAVMQNDMKNLLDNMDIGTIFLDERFIIKRFTSKAVKVFRLLASDVGRPLGDIKSNLAGDELLADAGAVLDSLIPREKVVQATSNEWYIVRVLPYRTLDNVIDGVVLTFTDITDRKKIELELQKARDYAENIVDSVREPLLVLDDKMKVVSASRPFYKYFLVTPEDTIGRYLYELGNRQWDIPSLRELLETLLPAKTSFEDFEIEHKFPSIGRKRLLLNARCIIDNIGGTHLVLLAIEDITGRPEYRQQAGTEEKGR